jgi:DNA-binding cell septation regulator SpoVG
MITVEQIKSISGAGNLRGFATINIAGKVRVSDCRIIQQPGKEAWVSMPSRAYDKDGQRKWAPIVEIVDEKLKDEIGQAVLAEYAKMEQAAITAAPKAAKGW